MLDHLAKLKGRGDNPRWNPLIVKRVGFCCRNIDDSLSKACKVSPGFHWYYFGWVNYSTSRKLNRPFDLAKISIPRFNHDCLSAISWFFVCSFHFFLFFEVKHTCFACWFGIHGYMLIITSWSLCVSVRVELVFTCYH